jgi:hypothetical protein
MAANVISTILTAVKSRVTRSEQEYCGTESSGYGGSSSYGGDYTGPLFSGHDVDEAVWTIVKLGGLVLLCCLL